MATWRQLRDEAEGCTRCGLYERATQTVFGEGLKRSRLMLIGEVPGDKEDRAGKPFVGPAGRELDRALEAAGIDREEVYVTNAVKHFSFTERGKRRIHQTPKRFHIDACRPWLDSEIELIRPEAIVLLGATAGKALLGSTFTVNRNRGALIRWPSGAPAEVSAIRLLATIHPSAVLRAEDQEGAYAGLVADLSRVPSLLDSPPP